MLAGKNDRVSDLHRQRADFTYFQQPDDTWQNKICPACSAIAGVARRICTKSVDPEGLSTLVACRLIPHNKCLGVRPISVGEVLRCIIGKAMMRIAGLDVVIAAGSNQVCAGLEGGCKAATHAMRNIFNHKDTEGILRTCSKCLPQPDQESSPP